MNIIVSSLKESKMAPAKYKELEGIFNFQMSKMQ